MSVPEIYAVDVATPLQFAIAPAHASLGDTPTIKIPAAARNPKLGNTPTVEIPAIARNPKTPFLKRIAGTPDTLWPDEFTLPCKQTLLEALPRVCVNSDAATHTPNARFQTLL